MGGPFDPVGSRGDRSKNTGASRRNQLEQPWENHDCRNTGFDVTAAERQAWREGFVQGAHDGAIQTAYSYADGLTLGLFGLQDLPTEMGWLIDPDNPYLAISRGAGQFAAGVTQLAWGMARAGVNVCLNACFERGTLVLTAQGLRPIEEIRPGDLVWSFDEETGRACLAEVTATFEREVQDLVEVRIGDQTILTTPGHPFWVDGLGWMPAGRLRAGQSVVGADGAAAMVTGTSALAKPLTVYNLEVQGTHCYFVGERWVLVHNACHNNAAAFVGKIRGYVIRENGALFKAGLTSRGYRAGNLVRPGEQIRRLQRANPSSRYTYQVVRHFTIRRAGLNWEGRFVERMRSIYPGSLAGNPPRRPY